MSESKKRPPDAPARARLVTEFDRNFLVEAGAGSGKTHSLASRMAAGVAAGVYTVDHMAAVTFTRKAAAELRGRFRLALEERIAVPGTPAAEKARLEAALTGIERLVTGTIHAFCAHLLRERPVEAGLAPGFTELGDVDNLRRQRRAWRDYVAAARASGFEPLRELLEAGIRPSDLDGAFATVCEHEDVTFDQGRGAPPDFDEVMKETETFWRALAKVKPPAFAQDTKCPAQQKYEEFEGRLANVRFQKRLASLAALLEFWGHPKVSMCWWAQNVGQPKSAGQRARELVDAFHADTVEPFLKAWRAFIHARAMRVLIDARERFAEERRRENTVNYVDLLMRTSALLRARPDVRRALQARYRWLFVDEFQDTDPIQAEIFLMLAGDKTALDPGGATLACDPFALPLRPGALFVVGDPKQSIFRFRRADIDIYTRVRDRIKATGGDIVTLSANFRSRPSVCEFANRVFAPLFASSSAPYSPAYEALAAVRDDADAAAPVVTLNTPADDKDAMVAAEADAIAAYVKAEVAAGRRRYGDFLVLTRLRGRLGVYADAFDRLEVPVEVSGAGLFCQSPDVRALALLLAALADPLDAASLVGVLRGPLFGVSDPELFQYRQAGGRFELNAPLPEADGPDAVERDARFGPALHALRQLQTLWRHTRRYPLAVALDRILEETGWLALASTTPGGARAGHLVQAIDRVREVAEDGGGLVDAVAALTEDEVSNEAESLPLQPGRRDAVRLMNLHKAKGLEAPVVILADPAHTYEFPVSVRIEREGAVARGHLRIVRKDGGWQTRVLGQGAGWDAHEQEEARYLDAERVRLLYVAGTRARESLVVCRVDNPRKNSKNKAWAAFEPHLGDVPALTVAPGTDVCAPERVVVSAAACTAAAQAREAAHGHARQPSWAVATPSGTASRLTMPARARLVAEDADAARGVPDTTSDRADAGAAWGSLIHGLLEHAMRHREATPDDLARLALWLTVDTPDLRPFVAEALDVVAAVSNAAFWHEARAADEVAVEVPFAVRLEPGEAIAGLPACDRATIVRGVIDLVHTARGGWRVVDYKTDRLDGVEDVEAEMRARHGIQVDQYRFAWERATGSPVTEARIVPLRALET